MTELSNWGRWGKDDQIGTLNLITPTSGSRRWSWCGRRVGVAGAHDRQGEAPDNPRPLGQEMMLDTAGHAMDLYTIWYHGSVITHIDALCHYSFEGKIYNGFERSTIAQGPGCPSNGIENQKRHHDARHPGRSAAHEERAVSRARHAGLRRPTSKRGRSSRASRSAAATRCSCAPAAGRSAPKGPVERRGQRGRLPCVGDAVAEAARRRAARQRRASTTCSRQASRDRRGRFTSSRSSRWAAAGRRHGSRGRRRNAARLRRWEFLLTAAAVPVLGGTGFPLNPIATF